MNILLIAPASGPWQSNSTHRRAHRHLFNGRTFRFSMLSLLTVAAETPPEHKVRIIDEQVEDVPFDDDVQLVGITCMTALAPRAYAIAARFRLRGIPVVLGGMHPTFCPEEALQHANAVVVGDAEGVWARVVADAAAVRLAGIYRAQERPPLGGLKPVPRHLLDPRNYSTVHAVQATRGCPHPCQFCSITAFHGRTFRTRPVDEVAAEVAAIPDKFFIFVDDNLVANRRYAIDLFAALHPLRKHWVTQATLTLADDDELMHLAAAAGCVGIFAGMETFSGDNLDAVGKRFNRVERYRTAIERLHAHGIAVEAGIVLGLPEDGPAVFAETLRHLDDLGIDAIQVSIATPLPGTPLFSTMQDQIIDHDWSHYDLHQAVFEPAHMTADDLKAGHDWLTREFYRPWRIARRAARQAVRARGLTGLRYTLALNLAYYGRVHRWHIRGYNPADQLNQTSRSRGQIGALRSV